MSLHENVTINPCSPYLNAYARRRGTQYAAAYQFHTTVSGMLDHPPARVTTIVYVG